MKIEIQWCVDMTDPRYTEENDGVLNQINNIEVNSSQELWNLLNRYGTWKGVSISYGEIGKKKYIQFNRERENELFENDLEKLLDLKKDPDNMLKEFEIREDILRRYFFKKN